MGIIKITKYQSSFNKKTLQFYVQKSDSGEYFGEIFFRLTDFTSIRNGLNAVKPIAEFKGISEEDVYNEIKTHLIEHFGAEPIIEKIS